MMVLWLAAGILLITTPWVIRNIAFFGSPMISSNTGINLYMGNNPNATGAYRAGLPDTLLSVSHDEMAFNQLSTNMAIDHILGNPLTFAIRIPVKIAHTFRSEGELLVWAFHPNIRDKSSSFSAKYRSLPLISVASVHLYYAVILIAGFLGVLRFRQNESSFLTLLFLAVILAGHGIFFGGSRFHFLLMPLMALYTARVLTDPGNAWTLMPGLAKFAFTVAVAFFLSVWILEFAYVY
jgi:hypothetical protein